MATYDGQDPQLAAMIDREISRRNLLKMGVVGAGGMGLSAMLAACGTSNGSGGSGGGGATNPTNNAAGTSAPAKSGGHLVLARAQDSVDMDKTMVFSNASIWVYIQIYENLTIGSKDGRSVEPWLATSWTQSDDKLTWTFKLREGVKFSDGSPLTSADVKFSIDQSSGTHGGWEFINSAIQTVSTPDPHTVVIKTKYPWAPLLADLACPNNGIIPNNYGGRSKADFYKAPIGSGPFKWSTWDKGSKLTLVKNPNHWRKGLPYLDSVTWQVVPDDNTRNVMIQGDTAQINENPPFSTVEQLKNASGVTMQLFPSTRTDYILMNETKPPFSDQNIRLAISYAIDRESLVKTVLFGHGTPANSLFMPTVPYYDPHTPGQQYDMNKAQAALAKSSMPHGFSCTYTAQSGDATDQAIAQILQASLKKLGITMNIKNVDPSALHDIQNKLDYQISHSYWTMDIADPDELVQFAVLPAGGGHSFDTGYLNKQAQSLAKKAEQEFNHDKRQQLYNQLQTVLAESAFLPPLFYQPFPYAMRSNVQGFFVKPTGLYDMGQVSLA